MKLVFVGDLSYLCVIKFIIKKFKKMEDNTTDFKFFPWENGEKPYWVNPENGIEWYIDKDATEWCTRESNFKKLNAVVFIVCINNKDKITPLERVLIDVKTSAFLASETSLEAMCVKIDMLRLAISS